MGAVFYLGAGWPQWKPLGIPGTHLPLKRGSWLNFGFNSLLISKEANYRYRIYLIKRRPRIDAADGSKITNKRRPRINQQLIKRLRDLFEDNKKELSTTW